MSDHISVFRYCNWYLQPDLRSVYRDCFACAGSDVLDCYGCICILALVWLVYAGSLGIGEHNEAVQGPNALLQQNHMPNERPEFPFISNPKLLNTKDIWGRTQRESTRLLAPQATWNGEAGRTQRTAMVEAAARPPPTLFL